jgi:hypothetical protein
MGPTDRFRAQHQELAELCMVLGKECNVRGVRADAAHARRLVAQFSGKLKVHAAMENQALYPALFEDADPAVRAKAHELFAEVGDLYDKFGEFSRRWPSAESLTADPAGFVKELREVIHLLGNRMFREHEELYPLVEARAAGAESVR